MNKTVLYDESIKPNDELIFSIIGDTALLWNQIFTYLNDNNKDVSVKWKYSKCGKEWFCQVLKKKKSLFWIKIIKKHSFRVAFWFAEKQEDRIFESDLPEDLKSQYKKAKPFNKSKSIYIDVKDSEDYKNVKILIDLKAK